MLKVNALGPDGRRGVLRISAPDAAAMGLVFIHLASLFGFIGVILGLPDVRSISIVTLLIGLIYILYRFNNFLNIFKMPCSKMMAIFILFMPITLMVLQYLVGIMDLDSAIYWIGLTAMFSILFIMSFILSQRINVKSVRIIFSIVIIIAIFQFIINYFNYEFVREIMLFMKSAHSNSLYISRLSGFFGHPNQAGLTIVLCCFMAVYHGQNTVRFNQIFIIITSISMIFFTGSRTSILGFSLIIVAILWKTLSRDKNSIPFLIVSFILIIPVFAFAAWFVLQYVDKALLSSMFDRVNSIGDFFSGYIENDESLSIRGTVISDYIALIGAHPLLGIGIDRLNGMIDDGALISTSQNTWVQWAAEFGIFYPIFGAIVFAVIFFTAVRERTYRGIPAHSSAMTLIMFVIVLTFLSFSFDDIFMNRAVVIVSGFALGQLFREKYLLSPVRQE